MPSLQIRDLPEDVYTRLCLIAKAENRSIAQQAIVLLKESLNLHASNTLRRKTLLQKIANSKYNNNENIDTVKLIREDRDR